MTCVVSMISLLRANGFNQNVFDYWGSAWMLSWIIAFPVLLVILPIVRKIVSLIVE